MIFDIRTNEFTFKILNEADANYTNEIAEYEEKLELVYEDSSY